MGYTGGRGCAPAGDECAPAGDGCAPADTRRTPHRRGLHQADEADDGAEGADVVLGEGEWFVTLVLGDAEDAVVVFLALLDILYENTLAGVEDIDPTPLKEMYLGNFPAGDDVSIAVERGHGVARDTNEEVGTLGFELRDGVVLTVVKAHSVVVNGRETSDGLHGDERYTFVF